MADHARLSQDIAFTRRLFRVYLLILFLLPLPLASNRPQYWSLFVAAIAGLAAAWAVGWWRGVARWPHAVRRARGPLAVLGAFLAWGLNPGVSPYDSLDATLLTAGFWLLAFLTVVLVRSYRRALQVLWVLVLAGLLQALWGTFALFEGMTGGGVVTGTFVNRNHLANLLLLALSAGAGLMLAQMNLAGAVTVRQRLRSLLQAALGPKGRLRIFMVLMVVALVLTRSRMGNTAFFAAITAVGLFALWRLRKPSRPLLVLVVSVLVIDVVVVGTWFGVEQVIDRIQQTAQMSPDEWQVRERNRVNANRESLEIIAQRPLAGWGGESFYTVYPAWRGPDQQFMDHAHNDFLEFLVEYGLVGGALLAAFLALCLWRAASGLDDRERPRRFGISFAALMAVTGMAIHATVDFSLHIPANAAWFVVLCMLPFTVRDGAGSG